jgi:hypothetical protein
MHSFCGPGIGSREAHSITDLAGQEGVTYAQCLCWLLPLTCLDIVEAILDERQPKGLRLAEILGNGPLGWEEQRVSWRFGNSATIYHSESLTKLPSSQLCPMLPTSSRSFLNIPRQITCLRPLTCSPSVPCFAENSAAANAEHEPATMFLIRSSCVPPL